MGKGRVLVAMSGGIDSSITALMLHEQGYELIGITMKVWDYESSGSSSKETGCCSLESINDARDLAVKMGFPHYILDLRKEFEEYIVSNFIDEYLNGRTPNPCVLCNTHIKWDALLRRADQLNCDYIATGHYAQIRKEKEQYIISKGVDEKKDQSYVLWGLTQQSLSRTMLPLGKYRKEEIKNLAKERGFDNLAEKRESYEICFVPDDDYRSFLKARVPDLQEKVDNGAFITADGTNLGTHKGYPFYTIGQRKGLNVAAGYPLYVLEIRPETNTIVLGKRSDLNKIHMVVKDINLLKYKTLPPDLEVTTKIRYNNPGTLSRIKMSDDKVIVEFYEDVSAITPGQSAVFYEGNDLIGGGIIV